MRLATVCTGIGAPDLAARRLGWEPVFTSEIDRHAFQCDAAGYG